MPPVRILGSTSEFMEAGKERLARDVVRDATQQEIQQLKRENGELKQLVASLRRELREFEKLTGAPWAPGAASQQEKG